MSKKSDRKAMRKVILREAGVPAVPAKPAALPTTLALPAGPRLPPHPFEPLEIDFFQVTAADLTRKLVAKVGAFDLAYPRMDVLMYAKGREDIIDLCERLSRLPPLPEDVPDICEALRKAVCATRPDAGLHEVIFALTGYLAQQARKHLRDATHPFY